MVNPFKLQHIKNYLPFDKEYDFNDLSILLNRNHFLSRISSNYLNDFIFESIFQIQNVHFDYYFLNIYDKLQKEFNTSDSESNLSIFSSLVSGIKSPVHWDVTDVLLLGLHGKVLYKINDIEEYILEPSDLLIIPQGVKHMAIGITPRITLSYGIFNQLDDGTKNV